MNVDLKITGDVQRMTLGPNDHLVVTVSHPVSREVREQIRNELREVLQADRPIMVINPGLTLQVLAKPTLTDEQRAELLKDWQALYAGI